MRDIAYNFAKQFILESPHRATSAELHRFVEQRFPGREFAVEVFEGIHQAVMELPNSARDVLSAAVRIGPSPRMKAEGFKKSRNTWHRWCEWGCQVVQVQGSSFSDRSCTSYTINIGGYLRDRQKRWSPTIYDESRPPPEMCCDLRQRIGWLMPEQRDTWWDVIWSDSPEVVGARMAGVIEKYVIPVLNESMQNIEVQRAKSMRSGCD